MNRDNHIYYNDMCEMDGWSMIDLATGSDYSGCSATRANFEWSVENWQDNRDIKFVFGGWGTYGVAYRITTEDPDIHEAVHAMSEHGVIDDCYLIDVEDRWISEAKESWAISDFIRAVEKQHGDDVFDDISEETIIRLFDACYVLSDEVWQSENCGMYIDVERMVPHFEEAVSRLPLHA
jgi:hypothetical protein